MNEQEPHKMISCRYLQSDHFNNHKAAGHYFLGFLSVIKKPDRDLYLVWQCTCCTRLLISEP